MRLFCFLLGVKSLEGTLVEAQIKKVTNKGHASTSNQVYKLKADTGKLCARKHLYTAAQLNEIDVQLRDYMHFWGYAKHPDPVLESPTQFAQYNDQTEEELANYKEFVKLNEIRINEEMTVSQPWQVNLNAANMSKIAALRVFLSQNEEIVVKNP